MKIGVGARTINLHSLAKARFLGLFWETVSRTSSGKFLRVQSCYPESFGFLCLCNWDPIANYILHLGSILWASDPPTLAGPLLSKGARPIGDWKLFGLFDFFKLLRLPWERQQMLMFFCFNCLYFSPICLSYVDNSRLWAGSFETDMFCFTRIMTLLLHQVWFDNLRVNNAG